ncbi:methionyl-tRNA formyltransferase [Litorimonas cladophorae]|uniref:Methionyl-tRNA formyltransferase n=1 Tax=Litorimonas cladophorae TaxID=1220491 RepID=A0A918KTX6_9PROT|nr:methionyl-tRNA formyltransferase [Litorimonas cladophorae]GGX73378.1 methionyl-tRNA formyltransferase [Litorimonas cladophorae]
MTLNVVFMGTPEFAVPSLAEIIASGHNVVRVYTQPPRRAGRGKHLTKSPVHQFAKVMGLPVETPESFRKSKIIDGLESLNADVACVVAYGQILPQRALDAPTYGCLNLHGSLLPRWRGAAPVQRAIMAGDTQTGVQIMQMAKGLDTGDILLSEATDIRASDTAETLSQRLSQLGAQIWPRALGAIEREALTSTPQTGEPTYAHKIDKAEARIDWSRPAQELDCHIRGLSPFPGAWTEYDETRVKILMCENISERGNKPGDYHPGTLLRREEQVEVCCGAGGETLLRLLRVQPAGKAAMSAQDFMRGYKHDAIIGFD